MPAFTLPPDYNRIKVVNSFEELVATPFAAGVNALCWERSVPGDFGEVVERLGVTDGIATIDEARLNSLRLSDGGRAAVNTLLEDQRRLRTLGLAPILDCIHGYPRDEDPTAVPTDVYSFHADSAPVQTDTWLCTYHGPPSEGLRNHETLRCVEIPETRARLLHLFGGEDNEEFREFLNENCYDLHYVSVPGARPFSFGLGNLWRIAVDYPGSPVPPCIHRAPTTAPGEPPRLLLIS